MGTFHPDEQAISEESETPESDTVFTTPTIDFLVLFGVTLAVAFALIVLF